MAAGYSNLLELAQKAAQEIASKHGGEGDDWDGAVWYERLADLADDGIAAALFSTDNPDVAAVVEKWLLSFGWVEFSHRGKRWAFDNDQLAEWDEDEEGFHFRAFHQLVDPTVESVTKLIDKISPS